MNSRLARILLTRGIIRSGTVIDAFQNVRGLSCECDTTVLASFIIRGARMINKSYVVFDAFSPNQIISHVKSEHVVALDGMQIQRIANAQNLTLDGSEMAPRSRRGRRKKVVPEVARTC